MATAAINAEYLEDALDFAAEMRENGREASFGLRSKLGDAWDPSGEYVETGKAHVFPSNWKRDFSSDVHADDLMFFVSNEVDVSACTVMVDDGIEYTIVKVKPFKPDQLVIFNEIQVRV